MVTDTHSPSVEIEIQSESAEVPAQGGQATAPSLRAEVLASFRRAGHTLTPDDAQSRAKKFYRVEG